MSFTWTASPHTCTHCDITHYLVTVRLTLPSMTFNWRRPLQRSITLSSRSGSGSALTINPCLKCKLDLIDLRAPVQEQANLSWRACYVVICCQASVTYLEPEQICAWVKCPLLSLNVLRAQYRNNRRIPGQQLSRQTFTSLLLPVTASPYVYLYLPRYPLSILPTPSSRGRQWQGSLNHKTPAGHRSRQPPH